MGNIFDLFKQIEKKEPKQGLPPISAIVAGLGNPGKEYATTRHNAGFMCADIIAKKYSTECTKMKFKSLCTDITANGKRFLLMKPQTFMNNSGEAVREAADFYKIPTESIIVISDDISLDVGTQRVKRKGSDGGQKGLRSIIEHLNSSDFPRVKVGVGKKPSPEYDIVSWVLGNIPNEQAEDFQKSLNAAADAVLEILNGNIEKAMNKYN